MATSLGQVAVLFRSTMPSVGLSALLAMPVLYDLDGMSRMAVPVVSEPVPWASVSSSNNRLEYILQWWELAVSNSQLKEE